jgi:hypothetical protein
MNRARRAAKLLDLLEAEGPSVRFLAAFSRAGRKAQKLVVAWLALGRARSTVAMSLDPLKLAAIGAEAAVVSTLAVSSWNVAFAHGGDWLAGAPLLTVAALESMRLPLAFRIPRLRPLGRRPPTPAPSPRPGSGRRSRTSRRKSSRR